MVARRQLKPKTHQGNLAELPPALARLKREKRWVGWKWIRRKDGKWTKPPYRADEPNRPAKSNDPNTWSTYEQALTCFKAGHVDGIGFALLGSDIAASDLDHVRDSATGTLVPEAEEILDEVNGAYVEVTVSGAGLRIIGAAKGPRLQRKFPLGENGSAIEFYRDTERYITISGLELGGPCPKLPPIDDEIDSLFRRFDAQEGEAEPDSGDDAPEAAGDDELRRRIKGTVAEGKRSEEVFWVINEMFRRGYQDGAIIATLTDRANGISAHIFDQGDPETTAARQVAKAKEKIEFRRPVGPDGLAGAPSKTADNINVALIKLGVMVTYDQFADRTLIEGLDGFGPELTDAAVARIWIMMGRQLRFNPSQGLLHTTITDNARLNGFHPVRDYLDGLVWDGVARIDTWLTDYAGAVDSDYTRAVGALLLIAAVRRVRRPGCKFDEMVVLEHPTQGTNKSTALEILAVHEDWFTDQFPLNLHGKQVIEAIRGKWIVEAAELSGMRRTDIEHVKALLSRRTDRARMSYDRLVTNVPRHCVFVGTTNATEYLKDLTGNRRFWPVACKRLKFKELKRDRDQLWAEAAAREASGASIRLHSSLWPVAAQEQRKRLTNDPYVETLGAKLGDLAGKISSEGVWLILDVRAGQRGQDQNRRVSDAMRALGWSRANSANTVKIDGKLVAGWVKGEQPRRQIKVTLAMDGTLRIDAGEQAEEDKKERVAGKRKTMLE
jgi:predicted P-loop ATPase